MGHWLCDHWWKHTADHSQQQTAVPGFNRWLQGGLVCNLSHISFSNSFSCRFLQTESHILYLQWSHLIRFKCLAANQRFVSNLWFIYMLYPRSRKGFWPRSVYLMLSVSINLIILKAFKKVRHIYLIQVVEKTGYITDTNSTTNPFFHFTHYIIIPTVFN